MRLLHNKIFVRITKENRESIYTKKITRHDGTVVNLWKTIPVKDDVDERSSSLMVQTGIVEEASESIGWIKKGDIAILNYDLCNSKINFMYEDGEDTIYFIDVKTTYHEEDQIAYQNRRTRRDQIIFSRGDYDELSPLLGIVRGDELIANDPYVFFVNESNKVTKVSQAGIMFTETQKIFDREVLAVSGRSTKMYGVKKGDIIKVEDKDMFNIKISDDRFIDAINDMDILAVVNI